MMVGSVLGVLFISLVRRVMVEDPELPFPESVAASEIHKAGQRGAEAAKYLFWNIGIGGVVYMLGRFGLFAADQDFLRHRQSGPQPGSPRRGGQHKRPGRWRSQHIRGAQRKPGLSRRGLHHRTATGLDSVCRQRAGLGIAGPTDDFLSWAAASANIFRPVLPIDWATMADAVWRYIVRPIAVGGMLVGAAYTLFKMRKSLTAGFGKAFSDLRQTAEQQAKLSAPNAT